LSHSLVVSIGDSIVFTHDGKWMYPLFALEAFIARERINPAALHVHDSVAGRAAASLMARMGIRSCHADLLSEFGLSTYRKNRIEVTWDSLVPKILCRTEDLLDSDMPLDAVYRILRSRASLVEGIPVSVRALSSGYPGKTVCRSLNLELAAGECLVIRGDNGCGKTTFLRTLLGLVPLTAGEVFFGGDSLGSSMWKRNRKWVAYMHQEKAPSEVPVSAREVIAIGQVKTGGSKDEKDFSLEVAARRTGCYQLLGRNYHTLSGGEKQRVNLARCLAQKARVLLLDEPTSSLDREGKEVLRTLLHDLSLNEMPTLILVTHDDAWALPLGWNVRTMEGGRLC